ncbi:hypothetical protein OJF2_44970 [Aquisphaera giovannonii]|uniref:Uncharacterized protein n=1 Tax=Aquisphaera giovannonii TaxID=406548 RepID=A0A5B9W7P1_9BACT|nr:hypothetical protein [Aquisphaera giovannonii]QEH35940.1 hypothetical protein OJF2_44970 [Aquisphaera giovannonii]
MEQGEAENPSQPGTPFDADGPPAILVILVALPISALGGVASELAGMGATKEVTAASCTVHAIGAMACSLIVLVTIFLIGRLHVFSYIMGMVQGMLMTNREVRPATWIVGALIGGLMLGLISRYWPPVDLPDSGPETSDPDAEAGRSIASSSSIAGQQDDDA